MGAKRYTRAWRWSTRVSLSAVRDAPDHSIDDAAHLVGLCLCGHNMLMPPCLERAGVIEGCLRVALERFVPFAELHVLVCGEVTAPFNRCLWTLQACKARTCKSLVALEKVTVFLAESHGLGQRAHEGVKVGRSAQHLLDILAATSISLHGLTV